MPASFQTKLIFGILVALSIVNITIISREVAQNFREREGALLANGQVLGGDFIAFYTAGTLFRSNRSKLYSYPVQREVQASITGLPKRESFFHFAYPPLVAAFAAPFSLLPLHQAFFCWSLFSLFVYSIGIICVLRSLKVSSGFTLLASVVALGLPAFFLRTFAGGQTGAWGVGLVAGIFLLLSRERYLQAGMLSCLFFYKPPLYFVLLLGLLRIGRLPYMIGFAVGALVVLALSVSILPPEARLDYVQVSISYLYGENREESVLSVPHKGAGLLALGFSLAREWPLVAKAITMGVVLIGAALGVWLAGKISHGYSKVSMTGLAALLSISLLTSVQMVEYDSVINIISFLIFLAPLYRRHARCCELIGTTLVTAFFIDIALPYYKFDNFLLSPLSILNLTWTLFIIPYFLRKPTRSVSAHED